METAQLASHVHLSDCYKQFYKRGSTENRRSRWPKWREGRPMWLQSVWGSLMPGMIHVTDPGSRHQCQMSIELPRRVLSVSNRTINLIPELLPTFHFSELDSFATNDSMRSSADRQLASPSPSIEQPSLGLKVHVKLPFWGCWAPLEACNCGSSAGGLHQWQHTSTAQSWAACYPLQTTIQAGITPLTKTCSTPAIHKGLLNAHWTEAQKTCHHNRAWPGYWQLC